MLLVENTYYIYFNFLCRYDFFAIESRNSVVINFLGIKVSTIDAKMDLIIVEQN